MALVVVGSHGRPGLKSIHSFRWFLLPNFSKRASSANMWDEWSTENDSGPGFAWCGLVRIGTACCLLNVFFISACMFLA